MLSSYSAYGLGKLKPDTENSGRNAVRKLRFGLGCTATAAAAYVSSVPGYCIISLLSAIHEFKSNYNSTANAPDDLGYTDTS
jgi:hypothetical protein